MVQDIIPQFTDPTTAATYLGESVGTHYSAALRAAEAYGKHLAANRESLLTEDFSGEGLGDFWRELLSSEKVRIGSPQVMKELSTTPSHYFLDFLDTADAVYRKKYGNAPSPQGKKPGHTEHAKCLQVLRDHNAHGLPDHFTVRNRIAAWMQMIRIVGGYRE